MMPVQWLSRLVEFLAAQFGTELFVVKGVLAVILVCTLCGMLGALVVGNRMAFFSDAMAHCAFAGVSLGYLGILLAHAGRDTATWVVPAVMVAFGILAGAGIVYVRERTGLAHDTVIGVFFAFAIGFGAMLFQILAVKSTFNPEYFLFGNLVLIPDEDLFLLLVVFAIVTPLFAWRYNQIVFASFNATLARTRGLPARANDYLFIVLLALVVNLSIKAVGALLINALLVVPAAAAANWARNLRQMFWLTIGLCLSAGLLGFGLRNSVELRLGGGEPIPFGPSGLIVVVSVLLFFATMLVQAVWRRFGPLLGWRPYEGPSVHGSAYHDHDEACSSTAPFGQCH